MLIEKRVNKGYLWLSIVTTVLLLIAAITSPLTASAKNLEDASNLTEKQLQLSNVIQEYLSFDVKKDKVVINNQKGLKDALRSSLNKEEYKVTYKEIDKTVKQINKVIKSDKGQEIKTQILMELSQQDNHEVVTAGISGCGAASIAGFAHTAGFTGLMTIAGVSGPAGWIIGTAVGGTWLAAQAAAGCLG